MDILTALFKFAESLYVYWAGIMIMWGLANIYGIREMCVYFKNTRKSCKYRLTDKFCVSIIGTVSIFLVTALFGFPKATAMMIDGFCLASVWYTIFLFMVSNSCLKRWPRIHSYKIAG